MAFKFSRLVRFEDSNGTVHYGEAGSDWQKDLRGQTVPTYNISDPWDEEFALTGKEVQVAKVKRELYKFKRERELRTHYVDRSFARSLVRLSSLVLG